MLRKLPAAVVAPLPRSMCKGAIPTTPFLSKCSLSLRPRQLRLWKAEASSLDSDSTPGEVEVERSPADVVLDSICSCLWHYYGNLNPVACQGVLQLSSPVAIYGQGQNGQLFAVRLPPSDKAALQPLLDATAPAVAELNEVRRTLAFDTFAQHMLSHPWQQQATLCVCARLRCAASIHLQ